MPLRIGIWFGSFSVLLIVFGLVTGFCTLDLHASPLVAEEEDIFPKPAPTRAGEPMAATMSLAKGAEYLDRSAIAWLHQHECASCHSTYSFLMARATLGDLEAPALVEIRGFVEDRVAGWDRGGLAKGLPAEEDEAVTEVVATAATLAFFDASTGDKLRPVTRKALDRMWTLQRPDGSWNWNKHALPPQELDEYYGVVFAALGVGLAPEGYAKGKSAKTGVDRLKQYLRKNPAPNLHHQTMLLWASLGMDGLMTPSEREKTIRDLLALQRPDGGWNLPSLGDWKRLDGTPNQAAASSDGYATGLVTLVLRQAGRNVRDETIQRAIAWLQANQRVSGRWYTRSVNADRAHYITNAGTAYALMALHGCGVRDK